MLCSKPEWIINRIRILCNIFIFYFPGICIKGFHKETKDKVFVNVTTTDQIPAPEITDEQQLIEIFNSGMPNQVKVPMSLAAPTLTKDNAGKFVKVIDVAINTAFFKKMEKSSFLQEFLFTIFLEGINDKYKIPIDENTLNVLKNRKSIGELKQHYIQNRDIKNVYDTYKNPTEEDKRNIENINKTISESPSKNPQKKLIEISDSATPNNMYSAIKDTRHQKSIEQIGMSDSSSNTSLISSASKSSIPATSITPYYKLIREPAEGLVNKLYAIFSLPQCVSELQLNRK